MQAIAALSPIVLIVNHFHSFNFSEKYHIEPELKYPNHFQISLMPSSLKDQERKAKDKLTNLTNEKPIFLNRWKQGHLESE
jgi:hypothetical protein